MHDMPTQPACSERLIDSMLYRLLVRGFRPGGIRMRFVKFISHTDEHHKSFCIEYRYHLRTPVS